MTPPLDLDSLRRQYPDMPGWGERVFIELADLKAVVTAKASWTVQDITIVCGAVAGVVVALKGTGVA